MLEFHIRRSARVFISKKLGSLLYYFPEQKPLFEFRNHFENTFELLPKCSVFHVACAWLKSKHVKFRTKWKPVQPAFQYLAEDLGRYILSQGLNLKTIETLCKHGAFAPEVSRRHKVGSKPAIQMLEHIS